MIYGLAGQGVDSDLGDGNRSIFELAVEPQNLRTLAGMLHHLEGDKTGKSMNKVSAGLYKKPLIK